MTTTNPLIQSGDRNHPTPWLTLASFAGAFLVMYGASIGWGVLATLGGRWLGISELLRLTISRVGALILQVGIFAAAARTVYRRPLRELAFPASGGGFVDLGVGMGLAATAMGILYGIYRAGGWLAVDGWAWDALPSAAWGAALWGAILSSMQAAIGEEVVFRAYLLPGLRTRWSDALAILAMSVMFAAPHLLVATAGETPWPLFVAALALPGMMLGWAYLRSGSLWLPIGIHFAWNFVQGDLLGLPGAAGPNQFGALTTLIGPAWLVGTDYGIEVGLLGLIPLLLVAAGAWWWTRQRTALPPA